MSRPLSGYLPLGFLRFTLSTLVFWSHGRVILEPLDGVMHFGQVGVLMFFVVSGLFILHAYHSFYTDRPIAFLINRALRIYPMLWFAYGISVAVILSLDGFQVHEINLRGMSAESLFLAVTAIAANLDGSGAPWSPLQVAWSIHVELKFYVIAIAAITVGRMLARTSRITDHVFMGLVGTAFLGGYVFTVAVAGHNRFFGELKFAPFFVLGACIYYLFNRKPAGIGTWTIALMAGIAIAHYLLSTADGTYGGFRLSDVEQNRTALTFAALLGIMLLLLRREPPPWMTRIDKWLGDVTYPLYLLHIIVISVVVYLWAPKGLGAFMATYAACIIASVLCLIAIDRPISRARTLFRRSELKTVPAGARRMKVTQEEGPGSGRPRWRWAREEQPKAAERGSLPEAGPS